VGGAISNKNFENELGGDLHPQDDAGFASQLLADIYKTHHT